MHMFKTISLFYYLQLLYEPLYDVKYCVKNIITVLYLHLDI